MSVIYKREENIKAFDRSKKDPKKKNAITPEVVNASEHKISPDSRHVW